MVCPRGVADRVNLGLIPSSEISYLKACEALKPGAVGMMHVHGNVDRAGVAKTTTDDEEKKYVIETGSGYNCKYPEWHLWAVETANKFGDCFVEVVAKKRYSFELVSMTHVKSYAPKVDHLVLDLKCCPEIN